MLYTVSPSQIILKFEYKGNKYIAFTDSNEPNEGDFIYFGKEETTNEGIKFLVDIQEKEYQNIIIEYEEKIAELIGGSI